MILDYLLKLRNSSKKPIQPAFSNLQGLKNEMPQLIFINAANTTLIAKEIDLNLTRIKTICAKNGYEFVCYSDGFKQKLNEVNVKSLFYRYPYLRPYEIDLEAEISEELYRAALCKRFNLEMDRLPAMLFVSNYLEEIFELQDSLPFREQFNKIINEVYSSTHTFYSLVENNESKLEITPEEKNELSIDGSFVNELQLIGNEIYGQVEILLSSGNKKILEEIYQYLVTKKYNLKQEVKSRLKIDSSFRIWLVDYGNSEVILTPLQKTVYLFFLSHPSGVYLHDLVDHREELIQIYKMISKTTDEGNLEDRIKDLTNMESNSINEKCSRIKEAFVKMIDPDLAKYYYITGERGQKKGVKLGKEFILNESIFQKL